MYTLRMPLFLVCCLIFLILSVATWIKVFMMHRMATNKVHVEPLEQERRLNNPGVSKRDCARELHSCMADVDCEDICTAPFQCKNFVCEPVSIDSTDAPIIAPPLKCNSKHGFITAISVTELRGVETTCINTLPGYFENDDTPRPYVCHNGTLNVDLTVDKITCTCPPDTLLMVRNTDYTPRCIPKNLIKYLPSFEIATNDTFKLNNSSSNV